MVKRKHENPDIIPTEVWSAGSTCHCHPCVSSSTVMGEVWVLLFLFLFFLQNEAGEIGCSLIELPLFSLLRRPVMTGCQSGYPERSNLSAQQFKELDKQNKI